MNQKRFLTGALPTAAVFGGLTSALLFGSNALRPVQAQNAVPLTTAQQTTASSLEADFMRVADTVGPASVSITTQVVEPVQTAQSGPRLRRPQMPGMGGGDSSDDPFAELFGPGNSPFGRMPTQPRMGQARGSGVIVRSLADGTTYVLTNDHVVENAKNKQVKVTLSDDSTYTGEVFEDFDSDLAIVKFKAPKPLPFVRLADSDNLHVGQWAIAIGSPFGQQNTMTTGIVSALHRKKEIGDGDDSRRYQNLIQTDASINPGNSGGPLLNIKGEMIGLNVAIYSPTGANAGIGYAIPSNTARRVLDQLISTGKVTRASLGVAPTDIAPGLRQKLGTASGAYISAVVPNTAAEKAGILPGDIITQFAGKKVTDEASLREVIASTVPNTPVSVTLLRDGKTEVVTASLLPNKESKPEPAAPAKEAPKPTRQLGMELQEIPAEFKTQFALSSAPQGVLVAGVMGGSPAYDAGLTNGMILTSVNNLPIKSLNQLNQMVKAAKSGDILTVKTEQYAALYGSKPVRGVVNIIVP